METKADPTGKNLLKTDSNTFANHHIQYHRIPTLSPVWLQAECIVDSMNSLLITPSLNLQQGWSASDNVNLSLHQAVFRENDF